MVRVGGFDMDIITAVEMFKELDEGWQLEKWRYCWWLVGLMWTDVRKSYLSTKMSISRKVTWEGEIHYLVQLNTILLVLELWGINL